MSFASYNITPSSNTTIAGQSIAEGTTAPGTINLAIRTLMADGRQLYDQVNAINLATYAPLASPAFTGQPTVATRGAVLHHQNAANASGRIYVQATGSPLPSLSPGDWIAEF